MTTKTQRVPSGAITSTTTRRVPSEAIGLGPFLLLTGDFEGALRLADPLEGYLKLTGEY